MLAQCTDPTLAAAQACIDWFYARMFRNWPGAITQTVGACTISFSGDVRLTGANHLWLHTPDALTLTTLRAAWRFFQPLDAAWSVIYTDRYHPRAAGFLQTRGFYVRWDSPLMLLDNPPLPIPVHPTAEVIPASTPEHLGHIRHVMGEAFGTQDNVNQRVARPDHLDDPDVIHYLIYEGAEPAACATVGIVGDMAGVWNVGTRRRFRRQGYAATLMTALLDDLRARGITATMLLASRVGEPLYTRLGYRVIGTTFYMGPP
ncbi:MAG: GNAT family N-acetyltransferase [Anaerolineae bacterium]|nr:GNAT family N-acetyltransferase [Anaerolineae bacterium]